MNYLNGIIFMLTKLLLIHGVFFFFAEQIDFDEYPFL